MSQYLMWGSVGPPVGIFLSSLWGGVGEAWAELGGSGVCLSLH